MLYDVLLKNHLPAGMSFPAFANDVALVAVAKDSILLGDALSKADETTRNWLLASNQQIRGNSHYKHKDS